MANTIFNHSCNQLKKDIIGFLNNAKVECTHIYPRTRVFEFNNELYTIRKSNNGFIFRYDENDIQFKPDTNFYNDIETFYNNLKSN